MANTTPQSTASTFSADRLEAQKTLAKLLAEENITIEVGNFETAFFNTKTRVLGLPTWSFEDCPNPKASIDLMTGHEVGHSRHTPEDGVEQFTKRFPGVPFSICNIVEDIRIERKILDDFPGLLHSFVKGYEWFVESDKFEIAGKDLSKLGFADRLNIRAKTRRADLVPLDDEEEAIYQRCLKAETYDDVLDLVEEIVERVKNDPKPETQPNQNQNEQGQGDEDQADPSAGDWTAPEKNESQSNSSESTDSGDEDDEEDNQDTADGGEDVPADSEDDDRPEPSEDIKPSPTNGAEPPNSDLTSEQLDDLRANTQEALDRSLKQMQADSGKGAELVASPTDEHLLSRVVSYEDIHEDRKSKYDGIYDRNMNSPTVCSKYDSYKKNTRSVVGVLVKEFERRKAAYQYSRATESRTGMLNINKLHEYKYNDQLFKSVTALADAKSHGMIMLIDMSGSMSGQINNVVNQTIQLATFCKMVNIPFDVYGFTSPTRGDRESDAPFTANRYGAQVQMNHLELRHYLGSSMKKATYEIAVKELWLQFMHNMRFGSRYDDLYGTPLTEALLVMHPIIEKFQRQHRVQKMNLITITDGDGHGGQISKNSERTGELGKVAKDVGGNSYRPSGSLIWKGKVLTGFDDRRSSVYSLLHSLKVNYNVNIIGFFLAWNKHAGKTAYVDQAMTQEMYDEYGNRKLKDMLYTQVEEQYDAAFAASKKKKVKFVAFSKLAGYDQFYVLYDRTATKVVDEELEVDAGADMSAAKDRGKLARAFTKQAGSKRSSRIFLGTFAEAIS